MLNKQNMEPNITFIQQKFYYDDLGFDLAVSSGHKLISDNNVRNTQYYIYIYRTEVFDAQSATVLYV